MYFQLLHVQFALNADPDKGYSTSIKKMIIKNSLDIIGDDDINNDDI